MTLDRLAVHKALSASCEQKEELLEIARNMSLMADAGIYSDAVDLTFHDKLLDIAGNQTIRQLGAQMRSDVFDRYWALIDYDQSQWITTVPLHMDIAQAIIDQDEARALQALDALNECTLKVLAQARAKGTDI